MSIVRGVGLVKATQCVLVLLATVGVAHAEVAQSPNPFGARACAMDVVAGASALPVSLGRSQSARAGVRPAAQVSRNEKADVTLELRPSANGGVEVSGQSGDLRITKTVQSNGEFVLELANSHDTVSIAVTGQGTTVLRGRTSVRIPRGASVGQSEEKARKLLAESGAVLQLRGLAATLLEAEDRSASSLALIMADATVGMLTGDVGAPRRIARFLAHRVNGNARPASMVLDCFALMETRMVEAFSDYVGCYDSVYPNSLFTNLCGYRWVIQVESYWFGFISCTGFSW